jgi:hypothetical protein
MLRAYFIIALLLSALATIMYLGIVQASVDANDTPKPSIPEFTLKFVDNSYYVPPTYEINPYTGENVMTEEGYHVEKKSIVLKIKNQPFTHYYDNGTSIGLFYSARAENSRGRLPASCCLFKGEGSISESASVLSSAGLRSPSFLV